MKAVKATVNYAVPGWNFCNSDNVTGGDLTNLKCRFCQKTKQGYVCLLNNEELSVRGQFISKTECCKKISTGAQVTVTETPPVKVEPKQIIKQSLDLYIKTMTELVSQGYPQEMAQQIAKEYVLGSK